MLIERLEAKNFLLLKEVDIEFPIDLGEVTVFHGLNGAGKSSIIDMITFSLFRRARGLGTKATDIDRLIYHGASYFEITLTFLVEDKRCQIACLKERGRSTKFTLIVSGKTATIGGDIVKQVEELIGFNYTIALSTIFQVQGLSDFFLTRPTNERFSILSSLFDFEGIKRAKEKASIKRTELNRELERCEAQQFSLGTLIENKKREAQLLAVDYGDSLVEEVERLQNIVNEEGYGYYRDVRELEKEEKMIHYELSRNTPFRSKEKIEEEYTKEREDFLRLSKLCETLSGKIRYLTKIFEVSEKKCPICRREISQEVIQSVERELSGLNEELQTTQIKLKEKEEALRRFNDELNRAIRAQVKIVRLSQIEKELEGVKEKSCSQEIIRNRELLARKRECLSDISSIKSIIDSSQKELLEVEKGTKKLKEEYSLYALLVSFCGKEGLLSIILGDILPLLEKKANSLLELSESQYRIKITLSNEEILVSVLVREEWTNYEFCSGGERFCIDLAVRGAMFLIFSSVLKTDFNFLFIDEGADSLDKENQKFFIKFMNLVSKMIKQVYIVTHLQEVRSEFNTVYRVDSGQVKREEGF